MTLTDPGRGVLTLTDQPLSILYTLTVDLHCRLAGGGGGQERGGNVLRHVKGEGNCPGECFQGKISRSTHTVSLTSQSCTVYTVGQNRTIFKSLFVDLNMNLTRTTNVWHGDMQHLAQSEAYSRYILNSLMYRAPFYVVIYRSYKLLKMVRFWPTLYRLLRVFGISATVCQSNFLTV